MEKILSQVQNYLASKDTTTKENLKKPHNPRGWFEGVRLEILQETLLPSNMRRIAFDYPFKSDVYILTNMSIHGIFAISGTKVLWLDNHANHEDFMEFLKAENLYSMLPYECQNFLNLFVICKLFFMGRPKLLCFKDDNPMLRSYDVVHDRIVEESPSAYDLVLNSSFYSSKCVQDSDNKYTLDFFIWTEINGNLHKVSCEIVSDSNIQYTMQTIHMAIGDYFVPR